MSSSTEETVEAIRRQMQTVRNELHADIEGVVDTAKELSDWKHYMRTYPWACLGAAAAVGFVLVPQRVNIVRPSSDQIAALARKHQLVVEPADTDPKVSGWKGKLVTFASNMVMRAAISYVGQQFGKKAGVEAAEATTEESASHFPAK